MNYVLNTTLVPSAYTMPARLGIELGADMATTWGHMANGINTWGSWHVLAYLPRYPMWPNTPI
jgi:hypothetical protein